MQNTNVRFFHVDFKAATLTIYDSATISPSQFETRFQVTLHIYLKLKLSDFKHFL